MKISGKSLELLLFLSARHLEEFSGYEISKTLSISSGTLYPLLVKLKRAGLLDDRWEDGDPSALGRPRRRYYRVNLKGAQATEERMRVLDPNYQQRHIAAGFSIPAMG